MKLPPQLAPRSSWIELAVHEAGHALLATRLGYRLHAVELSATDEAGSRRAGGRTGIHPPASDEAGCWSREQCFDAIAISLAGSAAEAIKLKIEDFDRAPSLVAGSRGESDMVEVNQWLDRLRPPLSAKRRRHVIAEEWKRARTLLAEDEKTLRHLANGIASKLREHGVEQPFVLTIEAEELMALIEASAR
jgi:hypothetical protein